MSQTTVQRHEPFISTRNVHAALDSLLHATASKAYTLPLQGLYLVEQRLLDPTLPAIADAREYILHEILVERVNALYNHQRTLLGLPAVSVDEPLDAVLNCLQDDARQMVSTLLGWSVVYHRYARPELHITPDIISKTTGVDERTLRRYQRIAIEALMVDLIELERQARASLWQIRLEAALPAAETSHLLGRDELITETQSALPDLATAHLLVTGAAGSGKSAFVRELLHQEIVSGRAEQIIWLTNPPAANAIESQLTHRLTFDNERVSLAEYTQLYRVYIVLDGCEHLSNQMDELAQLLHQLGSAVVIVTSRVELALPTVQKHIVLPELARAEVFDLVQNLLTEQNEIESVADEMAASIYAAVGGNPQAVTLLTRDFALYDPTVTAADVPARLYSEQFQALDDDARRVWVACTLIRPEELSAATLSLFVPEPLLAYKLGELARRSLLTKVYAVEADYALATSARSFIQSRCETDPVIRGLLGDLLTIVDRQLEQPGLSVVRLAEWLLFESTWQIETERKHYWLTLLWWQRIHAPLLWRTALETLQQSGVETNSELDIAYGVCLRRLGEWQGAKRVLWGVINNAGQNSEFVLQSRALLEMGILLRSRGDYGAALQLFEQVRSTAERFRMRDLLAQLDLETAQILVESDELARARPYVDALPQTLRGAALRSEYHLRAGQPFESQAVILDQIDLSTGDRATEAGLYTLLGRSSEALGDLETASDYLGLALTLYEQFDDRFGLARARCNLGAVYIRLQAFDEAEVLLKQAEQTQRHLGDKVALSATRHNLNVIRRARVQHLTRSQD